MTLRDHRFKGQGQPLVLKNIVNAVAPEPVKGFQPSLTLIFYYSRAMNFLKIVGSKVKVTEDIKIVFELTWMYLLILQIWAK